MKHLLIGWAVIAAIVAPLVVGFLVGGDEGAKTVGIMYLVIELVFFLTVVARWIGELVRP